MVNTADNADEEKQEAPDDQQQPTEEEEHTDLGDDVKMAHDKKAEAAPDDQVAPNESTPSGGKREAGTTTGPSPPAMLKDPLQPIPVWVETILRVTLGSFLAYCLAVANIPKAIPESQAFLVGVLGSMVGTRLPTVSAVPLMMIGLFQTAVVLMCAFSSALLCAVTVSDGLFVGMTAVFSLWASGLSYGAYEKIHGGMITSMTASFTAMFAFSLYQTVRDGVTVTTPIDVFPGRLQELFGDLNATDILGGRNATNITLPDGQFEGQNADLFFNNNTLTIHVDGGTWLVAKFWTAGVMNPLAIYPNFMAIVGWCMLCVFLPSLLPPLRTTRFLLSRLLLPQMLKDAAWYIRQQVDGKPEESTVRRRLIRASNTIYGGDVAALTACEPRLFDSLGKLPRCTWIELQKLMVAVDYIGLKALALRTIQPVDSENALEDAAHFIELNAAALEHKSKQLAKEMGSHSGGGYDLEAAGKFKGSDPLKFGEACQAVAAATEAWLESLDPTDDNGLTFKDGAKNFLKNVAVWGAPPLALLARLIQIPFLPLLLVLGKTSFIADKVFACIKFAIGFTAIACMVVYWDGFRNLEVLGPNARNSLAPTSFSGWLLLAYSFATMPTTEGTVKKCVLRLFGTCVGAFSAWLLLRATGENIYGTVAWLTVTLVLGLLVSFEKNESARFGPSKDYSYFGFYFMLTQTVIVMEYSTGDYDNGDELVVSRLVANLIGIAMATIVAVLPLRVMGSNPKYAQLVLDETVTSFKDTVALVLDGDEAKAIRELHKGYTKRVNVLRNDALYLLEDAKRLSVFPYFEVDPVLEEQLAELIDTSFGVASLMEHAIRFLQQDETTFTFAQGSDIRARLVAIMQDKEEDASAAMAHKDKSTVNAKLQLAGGDAEFFVALCKGLRSRIADHQAALNRVKWWKGFVGT